MLTALCRGAGREIADAFEAKVPQAVATASLRPSAGTTTDFPVLVWRADLVAIIPAAVKHLQLAPGLYDQGREGKGSDASRTSTLSTRIATIVRVPISVHRHVRRSPQKVAPMEKSEGRRGRGSVTAYA